MRGRPKRLKVVLTREEREMLTSLSRSSKADSRKVQRARILLMADEEKPNTEICAELNVSKPAVITTVKKCVTLGVAHALEDTPRPGRPNRIGLEQKTWVTSLARRLPRHCAEGPKAQLWTLSSLTEYIHEQCVNAGFPELQSVAKSTVWEILNEKDVQRCKIKYYLEKKDPDFAEKAKEVLLLYKRVAWIVQYTKEAVEEGEQADRLSGEVFISDDEEPGIQAAGNAAPDSPPALGNTSVRRDFECKRHGTISLLAGIDLMTGEVTGLIRDAHTSSDFIDFLRMLDDNYPKESTINMILDKQSVHSSKEVMNYLAARQGRFAFTFTPKHASWLNLVESFFSKLARQALRGLRVRSKQELIEHIMAWINDINEAPVSYRWEWGVEDIQNAFVR